MKKVRVALVGCGRISSKHLESISTNDKYELVALCDIDTEKKAKAEELNVPFYEDLEGMLKGEEFDLLSICTPSGLHAGHTRLCAKYGVSVLCEKPMATNLADGIGMIKACRDNSAKLFVVKQNRLNDTIVQLRKAIEAGYFGKIYLASSNVYWCRPQSYYDLASWRGTEDLDGGAFMNQASHYVDLLQYLFGPVKEVSSCLRTLERNIEAEDSGVVNLEWANGIIGSLSVTMLVYPRNLEGSITVIGEKGTVRIGGQALNSIEHWEFESSDAMDLNVSSTSYETESVYGFGHQSYYDNVAEAMLGKCEPLIDGEEGLKSLNLLVKIKESSLLKKTVKV